MQIDVIKNFGGSIASVYTDSGSGAVGQEKSREGLILYERGFGLLAKGGDARLMNYRRVEWYLMRHLRF
jgi:hypothetical protein